MPGVKAPVEKLPRPAAARPVAAPVKPAAAVTGTGAVAGAGTAAGAGAAAAAKTDGWSTTPRTPTTVGATASAGGGKKKWWLVGALVAVAAIIALVMLVTSMRSANKSTADVDRAAQTAETYGRALYKGDLSTLREITCDPKRQEFTQWDGKEDQYRAIYEQQKEADQLIRINRVTAAMINEDGTANVQVEAVNTSRPSEQHDVIIVLRKVEGEWKVCNAE